MAIICTTVFTFPIHEAAISKPSLTAETLNPVIKSSLESMRNIAQAEALSKIMRPKNPANVNILSASGSRIFPKVVIWLKVRAI